MLARNTSSTSISTGRSPRMMTGRTEIDCSHSVNRYSAAMVFFGSSPGISLISISTFSAVKSSMDRMRIFFLRAASSTEAMRESVVVPAGSSRITRVPARCGFGSMTARSLTLPVPLA